MVEQSDMKEVKCVLVGLFIVNNFIVLQVLGVCFVLVVIIKLEIVFVMIIVVILVMVFFSMFILMICYYIFNSVCIIVQMVIIVLLVIVVDQLLWVFVYEIFKQLLVFVGFIIINCIVMGCVEVYVMKLLLLVSFMDGIGNGFGYGVILIIVGFLCEFIGSGKLFGIMVLEMVQNGGWYQLNGLFLLVLSVFFIIGLLIWVLCSWKFEQQEKE